MRGRGCRGCGSSARPSRGHALRGRRGMDMLSRSTGHAHSWRAGVGTTASCPFLAAGAGHVHWRGRESAFGPAKAFPGTRSPLQARNGHALPVHGTCSFLAGGSEHEGIVSMRGRGRGACPLAGQGKCVWASQGLRGACSTLQARNGHALPVRGTCSFLAGRSGHYGIMSIPDCGRGAYPVGSQAGAEGMSVRGRTGHVHSCAWAWAQGMSTGGVGSGIGEPRRRSAALPPRANSQTQCS
jgi:hypothetical protein